MLCFELTDSVRAGFFIHRAGRPHIPTPEGCLGELLLAPAVESAIARMPAEAEVRAHCLGVDLRKDTVLLQKSYEKRLALVNINTAAGIGGQVRLSANAFDTVLEQGCVKRLYRSFPDAGIEALCTPETVAKANQGVEILDLLVVMYPGASFRITRSGRRYDQSGLDAAPEMFVKWTRGRELQVGLSRGYRYEDGLQVPLRPRRTQPARTSGFLRLATG